MIHLFQTERRKQIKKHWNSRLIKLTIKMVNPMNIDFKKSANINHFIWNRKSFVISWETLEYWTESEITIMFDKNKFFYGTLFGYFLRSCFAGEVLCWFFGLFGKYFLFFNGIL